MKGESGDVGEPLTVLHIIGGLQKGGGAEEILYRLVIENKHNRHVVMSLGDEGHYGPELARRGVEVVAIDLRKRLAALLKLFTIFSEIKRIAPDVVQTWMYYSDLIGGVCARLAGVPNVVWGIHNSTLDAEASSFSSRCFARLSAVASKRVPRKIISCSRVGVRVHTALGYASDKLSVVHNGYDLSEFSDHAASAPSYGIPASTLLRDEFNISNQTVCLGMVARFDPQKDHENLLSGLSELRRLGHEDWVCFLFGKDVSENATLSDLVNKYGLQEKVVCYGLSETIAAHVRQLDLTVLSSRFGEAFPNVLNEAMASKVPCVTTDVGDSSVIVSDCGWTVPVSDPNALGSAIAAAISELQDLPEQWEKRRNRCREHIESNFAIGVMSEAYEAVWRG
ncbi:MAG: glycosyltransferase [Granulosicoccus sp.]